jgi:hypothetical protein
MGTFDQTQTMFVLAMWAELGSALKGSVIDIETKVASELKTDLAAARAEIGDWELLWGPAIFQAPTSIFADNAMYVVRRTAETILPEYCIAIARTNPFSIFDGIVENAWINPMQPWQYSSPSGLVPKISHGAFTGLNILQGLTPGPNIPGVGTTLRDFISSSLTGPTRVDVTGHSLGGALACVIALWLFDTQSTWDPRRHAQLACLPFAGPTAGNQDFARYFGGSALGSRSTRFFNPFDVVPHIWNHEDLNKIPSLYDPHIPAEREPLVQFLVKLATVYSWNDNFWQIYPNAPALPGGSVNTGIIEAGKTIFENFKSQIGYQHVKSYFNMLSVPDGAAAGLRAKINDVEANAPAGGLQGFEDRLKRKIQMEEQGSAP